MKSIQDLYKIGKGPSSSHTIGPERAARLFREKHPDADRYTVILYGSLSKTGRGHGTDRVLLEVLSPTPTEIVFSEAQTGFSHPNTLDFHAWYGTEKSPRLRVESIGGGDILAEGLPDVEPPEVYPENSFAEILEFCQLRRLSLWEYVEVNEGPEIWDFLGTVWQAMCRSVEEGLTAEGILPGGLNVERKAKHLLQNSHPGELDEVKECRIVSAYAFAVSEQNADCGTIVTAPTCGACGVLPAALRYMQQRHRYSDQRICRALGVAGLIGSLIKRNASISGAECGCQAEIGSACAMAAAALCTLCDLDANQTQYAAEIALEHHLGLTCDPICGLVQIPCIERNAVAAMRAFNALNLSFFLSDTQRISFDMVVKTMYETGVNLAQQYRETSEGGLAKLYNRRSR
ncbi:MAG: serine dehydratase [Oscillospiraceae bacterium]|nr:serine dehydratase [Oscillospiraceae bacterium]